MGWEYSINSDGDLEMNGTIGTVLVRSSDFPQILALIAPQAAPKDAPADRVTFYINDGHLCWRSGDDRDVIFAAYGADRRSGDDVTDEYSDMAAWLIKHQPAVDVATVKAWGQWSKAEQPVYTFIQAQQPTQATAEAKPGPWYMDGEYLHHRDIDGYLIDTDVSDVVAEMAAWAVSAQPQASSADLAYMRDEVSPRAAARLREIRARMEAPADKPAPKLHIDEDCNLMTVDDRCVALSHASRDNIFERSLALDFTDDEIEKLADMPSRAAVNWLERRLDEVVPADKDCDLPCEDCDRASPGPNDKIREAARQYIAATLTGEDYGMSSAPEANRPRNVIITITFDPADTECAESIYRGVNSIGYPYRRDCVRTRVE